MFNGSLNNTFMSPDFQRLAANGTFSSMPGMPTPSSLALPSFGIGPSAKMQQVKQDQFIRSEQIKAEKKKNTKWLLALGGIVFGAPLLLVALSKGKGKIKEIVNHITQSEPRSTFGPNDFY